MPNQTGGHWVHWEFVGLAIRGTDFRYEALGLGNPVDLILAQQSRVTGMRDIEVPLVVVAK